MTEAWGLLVRQGAQALLEGRFSECERLAGQAARLAPAEPAPGLLAVKACREQGRAAEAEVLLRGLLRAHPEVVEGRALLGAVLADLGRDGEARRQLDAVEAVDQSPEVMALAAEVAATLASPRHAETLHDRLAGQPDAFAGSSGSVARHLGLLCHVLGRWEEAEAHFVAALEANGSAGAPVLVAHTRRHYSALLRARGEDGDWERAIDLLAQAASIYRRLEIERLAEEAELVLRRSQEVALVDDRPPGPTAVFRPTAGGWELAYGGQRAVVEDMPGLGHIATLLWADGRPVHAVDLVESRAGAGLGEEATVEYQARLRELEDVLAGPGDALAAALARAERDFLRAELAVLGPARPAAGDVADRARRLVALRIRASLDRIDDVVPVLARHLRRSLRTGTFCLYEPEQPHRWVLTR